MKSIITIQLCVLLLTFVSNGVGGNRLFEILDILSSLANEGGNITGVFQPSKNGYLGGCLTSVSHKGTLLTKDNMEVSMKFTPDGKASDNEMKMYRHLEAIGNTDFEVYGVPSIHYHGMWGDCAMMALTLFDPGYHKTFRDRKLTEIDLLILFREFVRITQYTHGRGVFHQHFHLRHMMFFKKQCFIYEFTAAASFPNGINIYGRCAVRDDWRQFILALYTYVSEISQWSLLGFSDKDSYRTSSLRNFFNSLKNNTESNKPYKFSGLRKVLVEFARSALSDNSTPITKSFYCQPSQVILEELQRYKRQQGKPVIPSWLSDDQDNVQPSSSGGSDTQNRKKKSSRSSRRRKR